MTIPFVMNQNLLYCSYLPLQEVIFVSDKVEMRAHQTLVDIFNPLQP